MDRRFSEQRSKHALNSIHKSCKLQSKWLKCDGLRKSQKNTDFPICQTLTPRQAGAVQRQFLYREWRAIESHCCHRTTWGKFVFLVSWTLNINAWDANCLFALSAQCLKKKYTVIRAVCNASLLFLFFAINCQRKARRALYFGISQWSPSSNQPRVEWIARGQVLIPVF